MQPCTIKGCTGTTLLHPLYCSRCMEELPQAMVWESFDAFRQQVRSAHSHGQSTSPAAQMLQAAQQHMEDRARTHDAPSGERSMAKTVAAFNALTGKDLSETEGWFFMALLKIARANQGEFRSDNYEDLVAYAALAGESAYLENQANESDRLDTSLPHRVPRPSSSPEL